MDEPRKTTGKTLHELVKKRNKPSPSAQDICDAVDLHLYHIWNSLGRITDLEQRLKALEGHQGEPE